MFIIGVTGGVGSGKSTLISNLCNKYNFSFISTDNIGKEILNSELIEEIGKIFGKGSVVNGELNRPFISKLAFENERLLKKLNALTHPLILKETFYRLLMENKKGTGVCFLESALLFSDVYYKVCNDLWFIGTDLDLRLQRLQEKRGYTKEKTLAIINNQPKDEEYITKCNYVISNNNQDEAILKAEERLKLYEIL